MATVTWTNGVGDGDWQNPGNWDTSSVPTSVDSVILTDAGVDIFLNGTAVVGSLDSGSFASSIVGGLIQVHGGVVRFDGDSGMHITNGGDGFELEFFADATLTYGTGHLNSQDALTFTLHDGITVSTASPVFTGSARDLNLTIGAGSTFSVGSVLNASGDFNLTNNGGTLLVADAQTIAVGGATRLNGLTAANSFLTAPSGHFALQDANDGFITAQNLTISRCDTTGFAALDATTACSDGGDNIGVTFGGAAPAGLSNAKKIAHYYDETLP